MVKINTSDLSEDIKSDIGIQIVFLLMPLFIIMAVYISDLASAVENDPLKPAFTLTLVAIVVLTLLLIPKGFSIYRWVPLGGLLILPPALIYTYHQTGDLILLPLIALIAVLATWVIRRIFDSQTS